MQHNLRAATVSLLAGIYDLNSEFYRLNAAGLFLNSSFGTGPEFAESGIAGPSIFPRTSAAVRIAWKPTSTLVLRAAVLDGQPVVRANGTWAVFRRGDGWLGATEAGWLSRPGASAAEHSDERRRLGRFSSLDPYEDKVALGTWHYDAPVPAVDSGAAPELRHGSGGIYVVGERRLFGRDATASRILSGFFHLGSADAATNRFSKHAAAGLVASGWIPARSGDQIGLAVTSGINGSPYLRAQRAMGAQPRAAETTIELSWLTRPTSWLTIQPDLQYVVHPGTDRRIANAWVVQLRFEAAFR